MTIASFVLALASPAQAVDWAEFDSHTDVSSMPSSVMDKAKGQ